MGIGNKQIGWSNESNLLWNISNQLNRLAGLFSSLIAKVANLEPKYKVYTALLTQSGGSNEQTISSGPVTQGVTYFIDGADGTDDFSNVGGPAAGTGNGKYFVAINSNVPNSYGDADLIYNTGAPVATVLENTIGNIWFTFTNTSEQTINSNNLFPVGKTYSTVQLNTELTIPDPTMYSIQQNSNSTITLFNFKPVAEVDGSPFTNTPIEIRVYN